jgi:predicted nucleic acid-binding protein
MIEGEPDKRMKDARVYLDTCVWCRPFDEVRDGRILDEAMAFVRIVGKAERDEITVLGSDVLLFEVSLISPAEKREAVEELIARVAEITHLTARSKEKAEEIMACGTNAMDALHIAVAAENGAKMFITTDDDILKRRVCLSGWIEVKNPKELNDE